MNGSALTRFHAALPSCVLAFSSAHPQSFVVPSNVLEDFNIALPASCANKQRSCRGFSDFQSPPLCVKSESNTRLLALQCSCCVGLQSSSFPASQKGQCHCLITSAAQEFTLALRQQDVPRQLAVLEACKAVPGFTADQFVQLAELAKQEGPHRSLEASRAALQTALERLLAMPTPAYDLVAVVRTALPTYPGCAYEQLLCLCKWTQCECCGLFMTSVALEQCWLPLQRGVPLITKQLLCSYSLVPM